tara:strand:+ start:117 stop:821 length:705 start_codon:yes stop_codon:yes gene_type:complete
MEDAGVANALCVSVNLETTAEVLKIIGEYKNIFGSIGIHPSEFMKKEVSVQRLCELSDNPKIVAIGETGLDYFRYEGDRNVQKERFRNHIRCALAVGKPIIVHTRDAPQDTISIMQEENAQRVGGVLHCFTESLEMAKAAIDLGFFISFSGIVTFKNAVQVKQVAKEIPIEKMLIETDSPFLAPVPYRGKTNEPAYVKYVAREIANLRGMDEEEIARITTLNFFRLFKIKNSMF